jgi:AraC-like DNA-binding protein
VFESYSSAEYIGYTRQEDYLKVNFWLGGKHTTVLDGFGEHEHDRPEAFITAGPAEMIKVDLHGKDARVASVALCVRRDFFPLHMGIQVEDLPEPLRAIVTPDAFSYAFHRFPLTADLLAATRAILAAPFAVRREAVYSQAKAVELMCLLINRLTADDRKMEPRNPSHNRHESRLRDARELLTRHYAQGLTLERISKEVGLNRMALTSGFRELFGMSVYDCLLKERMEHAYELLQDKTNTVGQVAEAVGYGHSCNFSTAFHEYFGCTPQQVRAAAR